MKKFVTRLAARFSPSPATRFLPAWVMLTALLAGLLSSCEDHRDPLPGQGIQSNSPKPDWGPTITPQMLAVIEELGRLAPTPLESLPPQQARQQPSFKDAVNSLLDKNNIPRPTANVTISERTITGADGAAIRAVIYTPRNATGPLPVIVYYHGGGWVIASPEVYEYSTLALAEEVGAVVVSVDYRLAPEHKFPTAHRDAFAAYKWVKNNAAAIGGNPDKVAVAGESAGGNMAVTVSMMARDSGLARPLHILSVFPVANNDLFTESYNRYANAKPLNRPLVQYFTNNYFNSPADGDSPLISLVDVANLQGLPPTTIIGAEIDPLQTEGMQLRDRLQAQGVPVTYQLYTGVTHEFFGMYAIVPEAQQAQALAATQLRNAFR
ncbi:alpha/beta hydrolase domain-containing protein [Fibrella aestuarina BUZ 2]|uniref:Alpha/beta hydrolase domain-containing protein n=1 Tax=Fibrella aestuarina BUZ 2 TaxID=1166018 RepID=I0K9R0_9BACT|nr:alpha/beta hydrolase [Fibrella aestuarina]CCH00863.1 alpha/beta hydrolase domain-containing protein [Fibrella aestuarina BUZ 2]